jgi:hypothetical protein
MHEAVHEPEGVAKDEKYYEHFRNDFFFQNKLNRVNRMNAHERDNSD